jgi:large subunit ribosomal protein L15
MRERVYYCEIKLKYTEGSRHSSKRPGHRTGSSIGKTSGTGMKGQNAWSGGVRPAFEEGQAPIFRGIPKVGFTNTNTKEYLIFNMVSKNLMQY